MYESSLGHVNGDPGPADDHPAGLKPAETRDGARRAFDPLTDPIDPADLLPLDQPGDPSLWERDRHRGGPPPGASPVPDDLPTATPPRPAPPLTPDRFAGTDRLTRPGPSEVPQHVPPPDPMPFTGPQPVSWPMATNVAATHVTAAPATPQPAPPTPAPPKPPPVAAPLVAPAPDTSAPGFGHESPTGPEPAVVAFGLQKRFGDNVAVADVTFSVPRGTILGLLGPNGAGKTTTVNMLCTLLRPDAGTGLVAGHDITDRPADVRRSIMLTGQFAALDESLTGRENLILFGRLLGLGKSAAAARADELLTSFGLTDAARRRVGEYSGGMRRRIDIACGLVTRPEVVFLDEPTTGLDPRSRQEVWQLVRGLRDEGVTTVLTTQYLEEADALADQIVVIDHGRVIAAGTADDLKSQIGTSVYQVTPADPADVPLVRETLSDLIGEPTRSVRDGHESDSHAPAGHDPDGHDPDNNSDPGPALSVSVPAPDGADTLVEIVGRTSAAGIRLADVALRRPSLDEVFLALTEPSPKVTP